MGLTNLMQKKLKKDKRYGLFHVDTLNKIKSDDKLKDHIMIYYTWSTLEALRLIDSLYDSKCFESYLNKHQQDIKILKKLLRDRCYKYNGFLFQNLHCLKTSLIEPFAQLDNIDNLDISDKQKEKG